MSTLQDFLLSTRRLLHDASAQYFDDSTLTSFINEALKQRDRDTAQNRVMVSSALVAGQNFYTLSSIHPQAFDIVSVIYIYGNLRQIIYPEAYSVASSRYQPYPNYTQRPAVFSRYGGTKIFVAPAPDQPYPIEWDVLVTTPNLVNPTDADPLPDIWGEAVGYYAAYLGKTQLQQDQAAEKFFQLYQRKVIQLTDTSFQVGALSPPLQAAWRNR